MPNDRLNDKSTRPLGKRLTGEVDGDGDDDDGGGSVSGDVM
jgi:hypothetical protein